MNRKNKFMLAAVLLALLLTVAVSGTLAYLTDLTDAVENVFTPTKVPPTVTEDPFDGETKKNVAVSNGGNIDAYIRAAVVFTWQNAEGKVLAQTPVKDTDYFISYGNGNWTLSSDGFWYYTQPVAGNSSTTNLIDECKPLKAAPMDGYALNVEILAQSIQAEPRSVVTSVWSSGVASAAENGTLTIKQ